MLFKPASSSGLRAFVYPIYGKRATSPVRKTEVSAIPDITSRSDISLQGVIAPGWEVRVPFPVAVKRDEDNSFVVSDELFAVYGIGDTRQEAIADYAISLIEYYAIIASHTDPLSQDHLRRLQVYLHPST